MERWQALAPAVFEHLVPAERGFPSPTTLTIAQDGDGFMWFGTQSGLGRWDGYRMRNFFSSPDDAASLPDNFIQTLHVDALGRLWIGTGTGGLAMFDKQTESFIRFPVGPGGLSSPAVGAIASDARGGLWIGTAAGLDYLDTAHGNAISHTPLSKVGEVDGPRSNQIRALLLDSKGDLWIGSNAGLARRDAASGHIEKMAIEGSAGDAVLSLAGNARGEIVFGTLKSGVGTASVKGGAHILTLDGVPDANAAMVLSLTEALPGVWWAASYGGGVIEFDSSGHGRRIGHRPAVPTSLANDRMAALWRDRSGLVWAANERGVDIHNPANRTVQTIQDGVGLQEVSAFAFMTDSAGRLWVGLGDQGIDLVGPDGSRVAGLRPDPAHPDSALPNRLILAMAEAEPQEAWIGTLLGLYHTSDQGRRVTRVPLPQGEPLPRIANIVRQGEQLWLGTLNGLLRYDIRAHTVQAYRQGQPGAGGLSDSRITAILPGPDGVLWVGTRNGINRFDPRSGEVEQIMAAPQRAGGLSHGLINGLAFDQRGRLWVATNGGGINILEGRAADGTPRFRRLGMEHGVPSKIIAGMSADAAGRMWISSSDGIAVIDTATLQVRALGRADGLIFQPYIVGALGKTAQSDIVFGTSGGYAVVHPEPPAPWRYQPSLVLSSIRLDRRAVPVGPLLAPGSGGLSIPAGTRSVEIEMAALDFSDSQRNRYAFRLDGYDKDWVESDATHRTATYANVPPGRYRLHLRGSNRDGLWSPHELELELVFLPAWYQTWWARSGAALALLLMGWAIYRWRVRQLRYSQLQLQQQVYSRTQHLERLNAIVKSINDELDFDALLRTILRESSAIGSVQAAYALINETSDDMLTVRASWQQGAQPLGQGMSLAEAESSLVTGADCIAPDIFLGRQGRILTVRIWGEQKARGYFIFEQGSRFAHSDLELFKALKEPFVSAFQKANAISAIQQARTAAEASARAKSDFLANISHEIRTPMNAILGFADLGRHLELPPKPREYFNKIGRAGHNLLGIIDDVLDFAKIESGKLQLEAVPFALADVLGQIADLFSWRAAEKELELVVWAAPDVPEDLVGDPLRLSQVLVNLVGNALKFTAQGYVVLRVELAGDPPQPGLPAWLRFCVEDTGVGIPPDQQARLFHAFSQADTSTTRLYGGTGLGLAISQQLVQAMGGVIEIDSVPSQGSRFHFSLGLRHQTGPASWPVPPAVRGRRILVIEDCAPARDMLEQQLRSDGFAIRAVASGAAGLELLRREVFDLVLLDWDRRGQAGAATMALLRSDAALELPPVVLMMTEFAGESLEPATAHMGAQAIVSKPINPLALLDAVLSALGIKTVRPALAGSAAAVLSEAALRIGGARVLVVDDNVINQQVAREVLMRAGVQVELAGSGVDAVYMVDHGAFDAVLMDIQMPGMDGYEATARIRAKPQHAHLPVIAMTAHAVAGFRESSMAMGMNDYVTKPIEAERLFAVLASWIRREAEHPLGLMLAAAATVPHTAWSAPGIDVAAALERLGGNSKLLTVLLNKFLEEFESSAQRLQAAIEHNDLETATLLVHKVRGAAGNLSMPELHRVSSELELLLLSSPAGQLNAPLASFAMALALVVDGIRTLDKAAISQALPVSMGHG